MSILKPKALRLKNIKEVILSRRFIILIGLFIIFSFYIPIMRLLIIASFIIINATLQVFSEKFFRKCIDIELLTFFTVLITFTHSLKLGIFMAITGMIGVVLAYKNIRAYFILITTRYILDAVIVSILPFGFFTLGLIVIVFNNLFSYFYEKFIINRFILDILMYRVVNITLNLFIFSIFANNVPGWI